MPSPPPDPELVLAAVAGDPQAWDRLLTLWLPPVLGWCRRLGGPQVDAEDLAHDTFIKVMARIGQLREPAAFPKWLYTVTRDTVRKHQQRKHRWSHIVQLLPIPTPERPRMRDVGAGEAMLRLLQQLPEPQREVIVLCLVEERTREEVATLIDVPSGTVKSRLRLGTKKLQELAHAEGLLAELQGVGPWQT